MNGVATVSVNGTGKTILTVIVDGEVVLDQSRTNDKGNQLRQTWSCAFNDGKSHRVEVKLGYKLTVKTRYVNSDGVNGDWIPSDTPDPSEPTYYTLVVPEGQLEKEIALLPLPSVDQKYPLRLLDYVGVSHPGFGWENITCRYVSTYEPGSDNADTWISQGSSTPGANCRYVVLENMIGKDAEIELRYNYSKICTFVNMNFEQEDGSWVAEDYINEEGPEHMSSYHAQDTLVDGTTKVTFDPSKGIFGDAVAYPTGTAAENFALYGVLLFTEHLMNYQWINSYGWSEEGNAEGAQLFKNETGLEFDPTTGAFDGVLMNAIDARNITMTYYWQLLRPVTYDANGGEGTMESYGATKGEEVNLAENAFTRDGYTFTGWNTAADGSGEAYTPGLSLVVGAVKDITLYAQWRINEQPTEPTPPPPGGGGGGGGSRPTPDPEPPVVVPDPDVPTVPTPDPEDPPVDIPDPDVPLVPGPDPEEPPVDIPDPDVPLTPAPPEVEVPDKDVPLAPRPTTPAKPAKPQTPVTVVTTEIPDEDVPLADVPTTGDDTALWYALALAAAAGIAWVKLAEKKRAK